MAEDNNGEKNTNEGLFMEGNTETDTGIDTRENIRPSRIEREERFIGSLLHSRENSRSRSPPIRGARGFRSEGGILRTVGGQYGMRPASPQHQHTRIQEIERQMDSLMVSNIERMTSLEEMTRRNQEQMNALLTKMESLKRNMRREGSRDDLSSDVEEVENAEDATEFRIDANTGAIRKTRKKRHAFTERDFPPLRRETRSTLGDWITPEVTEAIFADVTGTENAAAGPESASAAAAGEAASGGASGNNPTSAGKEASSRKSATHAKPVWPTYDAKTTRIRSFSSLFELQATASHYPPSMWKPTFCSLLAGIAQKMAATFTDLNPKCSYAELRDHLVSNLDRSQDRSAELQFESRMRLPGEDLQNYATELAILCWEAYGETPGASTEMINKLVLNAFHRNLRGDLGEQVRKHFSRSLEEAVALARNLEISGVTERSSNVATVQAKPLLNSKENEGGRNKVRNILPNGKKDQQAGNPHTGKECYYCGKPNHIAIDCRKRIKDEEARQTRQPWGGAAWKNQTSNGWQGQNNWQNQGGWQTNGWQNRNNNWQGQNGQWQNQYQGQGQKWNQTPTRGKGRGKVNNVKEDEKSWD